MTFPRPFRPLLCCLWLGLAWPALTLAAEPENMPPRADLSVSASRPAVNDQLQAVVFTEASGATPAALAAKVNPLIASGLRLAKAYPQVKAKSGTSQTFPVYGKNGRVDSWRLRSEIELESGDSTALAELLGKLQQTLMLETLQFQPSPEGRQRAEDGAIQDALTAFKARAALVAASLGKPWRIRHIAINTNGERPVMPMMRSKMLAAEAAPMPLEGGESTITATVSGQIDLVD